jgi:hypothetical protein
MRLVLCQGYYHPASGCLSNDFGEVLMVRRLLLYFEFAFLGILQLSWLVIALVGLVPAFAHTAPPSEHAHPSEAALKDPDIVQDFMAVLPASDPIPRQYQFYSRWTGRIETADRPEQEAYYKLRRSVTGHRFLSNKGRGKREMKAILRRAAEGFAAECITKGGYLEAKDGNFYTATHANIRPKASLSQLTICMRSSSQSLGALLIETNKGSYDYGDDSHAILTFLPEVVVTQARLDATAEREAAAERKRNAALEQERIDVERWRPTIRAGTETGCGPVLSVKGDMVEVVHYQTRDPRWFRRSELWPTLFNKSGLRTCP